MMKIRYINRDLFSTENDMIIHGCNAQRKMGAGVAKEIKSRYPEAYIKYFEAPELMLGDVIWVYCGNKIIGNAITQKYYGRNTNQYCDYNAIRLAMQEVNRFCMEINMTKVSMPKIGSGLGGGDWNTIEKIIEEECKNVQVYVYYV